MDDSAPEAPLIEELQVDADVPREGVLAAS
jgi:hypothetical protein